MSFLLISLTNLGTHLKTVSSPSGFFLLVLPLSDLSSYNNILVVSLVVAVVIKTTKLEAEVEVL